MITRQMREGRAFRERGQEGQTEGQRLLGNERPNGSEGTKRAVESSHRDRYYIAVT